jgi:hypothetical protein
MKGHLLFRIAANHCGVFFVNQAKDLVSPMVDDRGSL